MPDRYRLDHGELRQHPEGDWVRWSDCESLLDRIQRAIRLLEVCEFTAPDDLGDLDIVNGTAGEQTT